MLCAVVCRLPLRRSRSVPASAAVSGAIRAPGSGGGRGGQAEAIDSAGRSGAADRQKAGAERPLLIGSICSVLCPAPPLSTVPAARSSRSSPSVQHARRQASPHRRGCCQQQQQHNCAAYGLERPRGGAGVGSFGCPGASLPVARAPARHGAAHTRSGILAHAVIQPADSGRAARQMYVSLACVAFICSRLRTRQQTRSGASTSLGGLAIAGSAAAPPR
jgi:hypothetical protein